jgi:indolepyruvate ferredoxin oxidoreductase beta subunit
MAMESGSLISAVLFGAVAGTGVLPFNRQQFEATIERGGVGVKSSLVAFAAAFARAGSTKPEVAPIEKPFAVGEPCDPAVQALLARVRDEFASPSFPGATQRFLIEGIRRLVDYQDVAYASLYLDRMNAVQSAAGKTDDELVAETARHLALWMSYEDTIRVADLKTRDTRFTRVSDEVKVRDDQVLAINEYMHPRLQEICETLPAWLGRWLQDTGWARRRIEAMTSKGRIITTSSIRGFVMLYVVASMKRWRRSTLRYAVEQRGIEDWLGRIVAAVAINPLLAIEVAKCQRLVKGYSDTHERGTRNFATLMKVIERAGAAIAPATVRELRDAALADEHGVQLKAALLRHALA